MTAAPASTVFADILEQPLSSRGKELGPLHDGHDVRERVYPVAQGRPCNPSSREEKTHEQPIREDLIKCSSLKHLP